MNYDEWEWVQHWARVTPMNWHGLNITLDTVPSVVLCLCCHCQSAETTGVGLWWVLFAWQCIWGYWCWGVLLAFQCVGVLAFVCVSIPVCVCGYWCWWFFMLLCWCVCGYWCWWVLLTFQCVGVLVFMNVSILVCVGGFWCRWLFSTLVYVWVLVFVGVVNSLVYAE